MIITSVECDKRYSMYDRKKSILIPSAIYGRDAVTSKITKERSLSNVKVAAHAGSREENKRKKRHIQWWS